MWARSWASGYSVIERRHNGQESFESAMPRYAVKVEYKGGNFAGWQRQANAITVQECIETALHKLDSERSAIVAAGRTDSGVHALGQVFHCDLSREWSSFKLREALNGLARSSRISVLNVAEVSNSFSARFSATSRSYRYRIVCRRAPLAIDSDLAWHVKHSLDADAMKSAAACLLGKHDFTAFRSAHCQASSPVKTLDELSVSVLPYPDGTEIRVTASARSFLHRQVRSMVGTLERVGSGSMEIDEMKEVLASLDRSRCGPTAPAHGLYFLSASYARDPFGVVAVENAQARDHGGPQVSPY